MVTKPERRRAVVLDRKVSTTQSVFVSHINMSYFFVCHIDMSYYLGGHLLRQWIAAKL